MRAYIGAKLLGSKAAQPGEKPFDIRDTDLPGFILRVQPSGARAYYAEWGRGKRKVLAKVGHLTPDEARDRCKKVLGNVAHARPPLHGMGGHAEGPTLEGFLTSTYGPWVKAHRARTGSKTLERVKTCFGHWYGKTLASLTVEDVENWRTQRITDGTAPATVHRDLNALAGVLTRAVKLKKLTENVVRQVEKPKVDRTPKVRYLDAGEEQRLRAALRARDEQMRAARESANRWRRARKREAKPALPYFGDHLTPAVLVSINTGLRRGELLGLLWSAVDEKGKQVTVEGTGAKDSQTRHVPLNSEALETLQHWREQAPDKERVFPIAELKKSWGKVLERAEITNFRWHDLRHHFGSRLVQAGVPLNTVRELLGHASIAMTLRYAHLAPDQKREAVAKLVQP